MPRDVLDDPSLLPRQLGPRSYGRALVLAALCSLAIVVHQVTIPPQNPASRRSDDFPISTSRGVHAAREYEPPNGDNPTASPAPPSSASSLDKGRLRRMHQTVYPLRDRPPDRVELKAEVSPTSGRTRLLARVTFSVPLYDDGLMSFPGIARAEARNGRLVPLPVRIGGTPLADFDPTTGQIRCRQSYSIWSDGFCPNPQFPIEIDLTLSPGGTWQDRFEVTLSEPKRWFEARFLRTIKAE